MTCRYEDRTESVLRRLRDWVVLLGLDEGDLMAYKVEIIVQYSHHDGSLH